MVIVYTDSTCPPKLVDTLSRRQSPQSQMVIDQTGDHFMNTFHHGRSLRSAVRLALACCALIVLSSVPTFAQATKGNIRGTVADPNGQVIAGATVTAKNQNTGVESSTVTTGDGLFVIPELIPGQYT